MADSASVDSIPCAPTKATSRTFTVWTPEQARIAAQKGRDSQAKRRAERKAAGLPNSAFTLSLVVRVRAQAFKICDVLDAELASDKCDAGKVDRFASALDKIADTERCLSGRPLPGAYRPEKSRAPSRGPVEPV